MPKVYPKRTAQQNKAYMCYNGSMEEWIDIKDFNNYQVSSFGNIKSKARLVKWSHHNKSGFRLKKELTLKPILRKMNKYTTYCQITISNMGKTKSCYVHRLVATAFILNPDSKPQVNHKDGNGTNNNVDNLEWSTSSENALHAHNVLGRSVWHKGKYGEKTPTSKPIIQSTMNGILIKRWGCGLDAVREGNFDSSCISRACSGINKSHKGFRWQYE